MRDSDVIFVVTTVLFFALMWFYAAASERV